MIDYTISDTVTLPSLGKVYGKPVSQTVRLKSMTTRHEMMRLSHSEYTYKNLCDIIDDCFVEPIGISAYDLCIGDYQAVLYKLRSVTYGPEYKLSSVCPFCGEVLTDTINLDKLPVMEYTEEFEKIKEFELPKSKNLITLRLQSPRTFDVIAQKTKEYKKQQKTDIDPTILFTLAGNIEKIDGEPFSFYDKEEWLKNLPAYDMNYLISKIDDLNSLIGVDITLNNHCDYCGSDFPTTLRITSEFFRPNLS